MASSLGPQGRWALGMSFVIAVAVIWVIASFVVQFVEEAGTTPFLLTYICNSLFVLYIPLTELTRCCQSQIRKRMARKALQLPASPTGDTRSKRKGNWHFELWKKSSIPTAYSAIAKTEGSGSPGPSDADLEAVHASSIESETVQNGANAAMAVDSHPLPKIEIRAAPGVQTPSPKHPRGQLKEADLRIHNALHNHVVSANQLPAGRASPRSPSASSTGSLNFEGPVSERRHSLSHSHRPPALPSTPEQGPWVDTGVGLPLEGPRLPLVSPGRQASDVFSEEDFGGYSEVDMSEHLWHPGMHQQQGERYLDEHKRAAKIGLVIAPLWFMGQYTFNLSLILTSVTSNTILSSCSSLFTFVISVVWLKEPFTFFKLAMIGCVMGGTALVSFADSAPVAPAHGAAPSGNRAPHPMLGDALVLLSALLYACYTTMLRKELPEERSEEEEGEAVQEKSLSTALVFGFVGLFGALLLWPILLGLHLTGVETLHKMPAKQFGLIIAKGLLDNVLSDYLWARAVVLTTATAATVGLAFQTPVAIVADILINGNSPSLMLLMGGALVTLGFFGINVTPLTSCAGKLDGGTLEPGGLEMPPDHQKPADHALRTASFN